MGTSKLRDWSKRIGGRVGRSREGVGHQFLSPWVVKFLTTHGGGSSCFTTGIVTHVTKLTTEVTPLVPKDEHISSRGLKSTLG